MKPLIETQLYNWEILKSIGVWPNLAKALHLGCRDSGFKSLYSDCDYSLMVERWIVVPLVRVRFSLVTYGRLAQ